MGKLLVNHNYRSNRHLAAAAEVFLSEVVAGGMFGNRLSLNACTHLMVHNKLSRSEYQRMRYILQ